MIHNLNEKISNNFFNQLEQIKLFNNVKNP